MQRAKMQEAPSALLRRSANLVVESGSHSCGSAIVAASIPIGMPSNEWNGEWQDAEEHADRAHEFFERGRYPEAEAELRKALSVDPERGEWQFNLGLTLEAAGRDNEAIECFRRAIELEPGAIEPYLAAGGCANRQSRHEEALTFLETAARIDPTNEAAYSHRIEALAELGRHEDAETVYFLAQDRLDEMPRCLAAMGESLFTRGLHDRAAWCFREAIRQEPSLPRVRARLAAVVAAGGQPQKALQLLLQELREDPGSVETILEFGTLLVELNRLPEAAEKFSRAVELEPANALAHWSLGDLALHTGRPDQAVVEFELVQRLDPDFPSINMELAEANLRLGDLNAARSRLRAHLAVEDEPVETSNAAERLGTLLLDAGLFAEAAVILKKAVERHAQAASLWRQIAFARFRIGERAGGIEASRRLLELEPDRSEAVHNLALAALEAGDHAEARRWIRTGASRWPHDPGFRHLRTRLMLSQVAALAMRGVDSCRRLVRRVRISIARLLR